MVAHVCKDNCKELLQFLIYFTIMKLQLCESGDLSDHALGSAHFAIWISYVAVGLLNVAAVSILHVPSCSSCEFGAVCRAGHVLLRQEPAPSAVSPPGMPAAQFCMLTPTAPVTCSHLNRTAQEFSFHLPSLRPPCSLPIFKPLPQHMSRPPNYHAEKCTVVKQLQSAQKHCIAGIFSAGTC